MGTSMKTTSGKILASVALVGTAAAVAGMGTYGAFTSTTSASQAVTAGTVVIDLGASNTLAVAVTGLLPGDSVEKFATLTNSGSSALNNITLTASTASPTALTSDTTKGLQLTIESCSTAWTVVAAAADTCSGTTTTVLAKSPVIGANQELAGLASLAARGTDNLKVTTTLPTTADNTFQGLTSTIVIAFTGTQRTETVK
jgi:spore coat-associated protein N